MHVNLWREEILWKSQNKWRNYKNINNKVENGEVPLQENILTIGMYGEDVDFYILKGILENILESISLSRYDIEDEKLGTNKKSVAYSLIFRDKNKTLSDEVISKVMDEIIGELKDKFGAELRWIFWTIKKRF